MKGGHVGGANKKEGRNKFPIWPGDRAWLLGWLDYELK